MLLHLAEFKFAKEENGWLRKGECPSCHKKELYTSAAHPWVLRCGRLAKCGAEWHVKELYPELFQDWSKRAAPRLPTNPNAAADDYLAQARGFDLARIKGWYRQESHYDPKADNGRGAGSATVRFPVADGFWERLIDRPGHFGKKKAAFKPGMHYQGTWWQPPGLQLADVHRLWMVEGIFDAIAMQHHDVPAVALLSCNNYPEQALAELRKAHAERGTECVLVWALDSDPAGAGYVRKWVARAREAGWQCEAAQIPQTGKTKVDWNDLHQRDRLAEKHLADYLYHGALLIAASASEKGLLMYRHAGGKKTEFSFDHDNRLFWFKLDLDAFHRAVNALEKEGRHDSDEELREEALKQAHVIRPIANCLPRPLYYQANLITDESWYYFNVSFPHDGKPVKNTFSAGALSAAAEFKKRLLSIAPGAVFSGTSSMLERMMEEGLYNIHRVETIDFIGYAKEHGCYLLGDVAVRAGKSYDINAEDFFDFGKLSLKSLNQSVQLGINRDLAEYRDAWFPLLWRCFGAKGLAALAFWLGALFAEQIRATQKSFPFLEIVGEAGAGKSTLLEFMWKLLGRADYEGFDPSKSSLAARARNFAQVANLPVVLIESDREKLGSDKGGPHVKSFDWDELKTAFNGRSVRARGMATGGNETYEPPFRGAIVISQNNAVQASEPILQRIVHLTFDRAGQTPKTREAAIALEQMSLGSVSGFILRAALREAEILKLIAERTPVHEAALQARPGVKSTRIAKNHGQLAALADALRLLVPMSDEQHEALQLQVAEMAEERQQAINADHPIVSEFWETFEFLDEGNYPLNHSRRPDEQIAVNLNHFIQGCREKGQAAPAIADLKKLLRTSKRYAFVDCRVVNSALKADNQTNASTSLWCWVFDRQAAKRG